MTAVSCSTLTRVILVRHGQSDFNAEGRFQGSLDRPQLTARGWKTAVACGHHLKSMHFDIILCSNLQRARQTAEGILSTYSAANAAPPIEYDARLREIHLPGWEGLPIETVRNLFPADYKMWKEDPAQLVLNSPSELLAASTAAFSPLAAMQTRAAEFWSDLLRHRHGQTVMIVGHGAAISVMIAVALNLPTGIVHCLQQSNGGVSCLEFACDKPGSAKAIYTNRTQHLGEILPKMKEGRTGLRILLLSQVCALSGNWSSLLPEGSFKIVGGAGSEELITSALEQAEDKVQTMVWAQPAGHLSEKVVSALRLGNWENLEITVDTDVATVLHYPRPGGPPIVQAINIDATFAL